MSVNAVNSTGRYTGVSQPNKNKKAENNKPLSGFLTEEQIKELENLEKDNQFSKLKRNQSMGRDQFMHILLTQLTHQNPLEPLKDQDFIAQMAQFSSLEELKSMDQRLMNFEESIDSIRNTLIDNKLGSQNSELTEKLDLILEELKKLSTHLNAEKVKEAYE